MPVYKGDKLLGYYDQKAAQAVRSINNNDLRLVILSRHILFELVQLFGALCYILCTEVEVKQSTVVIT